MIFSIVNRITASVLNETVSTKVSEVTKQETFELVPDFRKNTKFTVDLSLPKEMQLLEMHKVAKTMPVEYFDISNFNNIILENIVRLHINMNEITDV